MRSLLPASWTSSSRLLFIGLSLSVLLMVACASTSQAPASTTPAPAAAQTPKPAAPAAPSPAAVPVPVTPTAPASKLIQIPGGPAYDPAVLAKEPGIQILKKYDNSAQPRWTKAVYGGDYTSASASWTPIERNHDAHRVLNYTAIDLAFLFYYDTGLCSLVGREGHFDTCEGQVAHTEEFVLVPGMIERWTLNSPLEYTFTVRKGMKWPAVPAMTRQDREITAEDIAWYMNQTKKDGLYRESYALTKSIMAVDRYTIKVAMQEPYAEFLRNLTFTTPFPRECFEAKDCLGAQASFAPGPMVIREYTARLKAVFARNPEFFLKGLPYLDTYTQIFVPDVNAQKALFYTAKLDVSPSSARLSEIQEMQKRVTDSRILGVFLLGGGHSLYINYNSSGPLSDVRVRRAMAMTMDLPKIFDVAFEGFTVFSHLIPHEYSGDPSFYLIPATAGKWYQFNPDEAKKLMAEAGYSNGFTLKIDPFNRQSAQDTDLILQSQWKQYLNIDVKIVQSDSVAHDTNYFGGQWEGLWQANCDNNKCGSSADETFEMFVSTSNTNFSHVKDPKIDDMYRRQHGELDPVKRRAILWEYEQYELDNLHLIHGGLPTNLAVLQPWVMNYGIHQWAWACRVLICMVDASKQPVR